MLCWPAEQNADQGKVRKGFLVNRALLPYIYKAICLMLAGESADKIDQAMVRFGMPMGPIELADQVGLDVCYDVGLVLGMPEAAETALKEKLSAGTLGRKTGSGFYAWEDKRALRDRASYPQEELDRLAAELLAPMVDKCRTAVAEGIVASPDDADIGCILALAFHDIGVARLAGQNIGVEYRGKLLTSAYS